MSTQTARVGSNSRTGQKTVVAVLVFAVLFALLFQYRALSLMGKLGVNVTPLGTKFPITLDFQSAPLWLQPFYYTFDYLNTVWSTTVLGVFIAGAAMAFLPGLVQHRLRGNGMAEHFAGVLLGLPNMFCTCCSVSTVSGLRKAGAGLGPSLAFFITSPALNTVVILLAFEVLPLKLAIIRTLLGLIAAFGVTYMVARLYPGVGAAALEMTAGVQNEETVGDMLVSWMRHTWEIARTVIPLLVGGIFLISVIKAFVSFEAIAQSLGNGLWPTLFASVVGTVVMVPTFTEVLWVRDFMKVGMGMGPAIAFLITLPSVSLPSLWVLGKVLGSYRLAVTLGASILLLGFVAGMIFSAF